MIGYICGRRSPLESLRRQAGQDIKGVETARVGLHPVGKGRRQKRAGQPVIWISEGLFGSGEDG